MLDYAAPRNFEPATVRRGVGEHPHRGFETVTIVYQGELEHRDSAGNGGRIGPGDVQWMTAASGVVHEEFHSEKFTRSGGKMEMMQLWVNLPAKDKMSPPRYQTLLDAEIPSVPLPDGAGRIRVIAGEFGGHKGPAKTFTPMNVWDLRLSAGKTATLVDARGPHDGRRSRCMDARSLNGTQAAGEAQLAIFDRQGGEFTIGAETEATLLVLSGEPLNEPVVGYGPFVMTSDREIAQAIRDYQSGRFGSLPAS